jgi:hypothetical protein
LCGIALDPFCPARNGSSTSRTSVRVTDLGREPLQTRARQRDRLQQLCVAVARDDLRRDVLARDAQALQHALLELGARRGVRPNGA